ncbi:hypothetical protein VMT65_01600 [Nocardia sp. CDC153]|uniref:hypothetical protein n=1 Tax=Nocardia sp. CDC153 TaxID=3112167 RepID=UPI002DB97133|nr:hypothetical protein [Nocardia sp. CDC153]MEC3951717.1 hypothetical protein [Nocardia sp. CDC153]
MIAPQPDPRLHGRPELAMLLDDLLRRAWRRWRDHRTGAPPAHRATEDIRGTEE